jgi:hypothetical protein
LWRSAKAAIRAPATTPKSQSPPPKAHVGRVCFGSWPLGFPRSCHILQIKSEPPLIRLFTCNQLHSPHPQPIAGNKACGLDTPTVDEGAVGTVEISYLQLAAWKSSQTAVHARDERGVNNEIGARRPPDCSDGARQNTEGLLGDVGSVGYPAKNPHLNQAVIRTFRPDCS